MKKEIIDGTIDGITDADPTVSHPLLLSPTSPVKLLKRKRPKSRSLSESNINKEKRTTWCATATSLDNQEAEDHIQPSTSRSSNLQSKTTLVKKKKILKKRNAANVLQKKKRMNIADYVDV